MESTKVISVAEMDKMISRYNDEARVLALHAMDYARHIGTDKEEFLLGQLLIATERIRLLHIEKCEMFNCDVSEYAKPM